MYNQHSSVIALEVISIDGKNSAVLLFKRDLSIAKAAQQIAYQQNLENLLPQQYVIADAYTGIPYDSKSLISTIPEFSSIRLIPTGAAAGFHYSLKRFSLGYIVVLLICLGLFASAITRFPSFLYDSLTFFGWSLLLIMLCVSCIAFALGFVKSELVYVTDSYDLYQRLESASKMSTSIIAISLLFGSLVCVISYQLGIGSLVSIIRGTVVSLIASVIVIVASAFSNKD
jgi:hypothetical protein